MNCVDHGDTYECPVCRAVDLAARCRRAEAERDALLESAAARDALRDRCTRAVASLERMLSRGERLSFGRIVVDRQALWEAVDMLGEP